MTVSAMATLTGWDRRTLERFIADRNIQPVRVTPRPVGDIKYYSFIHLWKARGEAGVSDGDLITTEADVKIANGKQDLIRKTRDNKIDAGEVAPVSIMATVIAQLATSLSREVDQLVPLIKSNCKDVSAKALEKVEHRLAERKNEISRMPERLLSAVAESINAGAETTTD